MGTAIVYDSLKLTVVLNKIGPVTILVDLRDLVVAYWTPFLLTIDVFAPETNIVANHRKAAGEVIEKFLQFAGEFCILNVSSKFFGG